MSIVIRLLHEQNTCKGWWSQFPAFSSWHADWDKMYPFFMAVLQNTVEIGS